MVYESAIKDVEIPIDAVKFKVGDPKVQIQTESASKVTVSFEALTEFDANSTVFYDSKGKPLPEEDIYAIS